MIFQILKKLLGIGLILIVALALMAGAAILLSDDPAKELESLAIRHADKLPLAYFGEKLFDNNCAACHDNPATHAPGREALAGFSKESVMVTLGFGKMQPMAAHLSKREQFLIAVYLTGTGGDETAWIEQHRCDQPAQETTKQYAVNWGLGTHNRRFVSADKTNIGRDNVGIGVNGTLDFFHISISLCRSFTLVTPIYFKAQ